MLTSLSGKRRSCAQRASPLLGHHQQSLDQESFHDLRSDSLEQGKRPFMFNDVIHHFAKVLERLALSTWGRSRLQSDLSHDQWLCCNGCQCLRHCSQGYKSSTLAGRPRDDPICKCLCKLTEGFPRPQVGL